MQYGRGAAKEAIENCVIYLQKKTILRPNTCILRKYVGQKHVARAFIDDVVKGPQIRPSESDKLSQMTHDIKALALQGQH